MVSPFGPVEHWREVGRRWTDTQVVRDLQVAYPDPPAVFFISNNEHSKLQWAEVEQSRRYIDLYGLGRSDNFKRRVVAEGWAERYRALQEGMREGLTNQNWQNNARFIGYEAFGPRHFGRWGGWPEYSLYTPNQIDPSPLTWDGGSPSYYVDNWAAITDFTVWSPQIGTQNWVFMLEEALATNPEFWFEMSIWDGHYPGEENDQRKQYEDLGQTFSPERYAGMVQFGMWMLRPRLVRDFRLSFEKRVDQEPYFLPIVAAVDRVHDHPALGQFWRQGKLVANRSEPHPYQSSIPTEYEETDRWFMLSTNLDPPRPWDLMDEIPVYSLALVLGEAPQRQWLVYAYSPLGGGDVTVTIPDYGPVDIRSSVAGSFFVVDESTGEAELLDDTLAPLPEPPPVNHLPVAAFSVTCVDLTCTFADQSTDDVGVTAWSWDFGDGNTSTEQHPNHVYEASGDYMVVLTVENAEQGTDSVFRTVNVTDSSPPPNDPPVAAFSILCTELSCTYTDQSTDGDGSVVAWSWDFGDGDTSATQNPSHTYAADGTYTVTLTVTDDAGDSADTTSQSVTVVAAVPNNPPVASFNWSCTDRSCSFTDTSTDGDGSVVAWSWDFGDGDKSSERNPRHMFTKNGTFEMTLVVADDDQANGAASQSVLVESETPAILTLTATSKKVRRYREVYLNWSGATTNTVDIFRNGTRIATNESNDGSFSDHIRRRSSKTYLYRVCQAGSSVCSNDAAVRFGFRLSWSQSQEGAR
jgi:PKD repeat protein